MKKLSAETWSHGWQFPRLTSFGSSLPDNYDGAFLEFWKQQAEGEYGHVIDLACGNGALVWIFNELLNSGDRKTEITGVDFANIAPFNALQRKKEEYPGIRFIGNSPIEKLPFDDNSIDLAVSQFGVEYSNLDESIPEISRVLTPSGKMSFILHDKAGHVAMSASRYIGEYESMLYESNAHNLILEHDKIAESYDYDINKMQSSSEFQAMFARINQAVAPFVSLIKTDQNDLRPLATYLRQLDHAGTQIFTPPAQREIPLETLVNNAYNTFKLTIERLGDLITISLDEEARQRLQTLIIAEGFTITEFRPLLYKEGENWGTALVAKRQTS